MFRDKASSLASLRGLSTAIAVTALVVVGSLLAASAFHLAWFGRVQSGMAETPAEAAGKATALDDLRASLGHGGLLQNLTLYAETSEPAAREAMSANMEAATKALRGYQGARLTPAESALARDLDRMLDTYRRILADKLDPNLLSGTAGLTLITQHAAIADRIARLSHDQAIAERSRLAEIAGRGFWLGVAAVLALAASLGAILWMLHARLLAPMKTLAASVVATANGDWRAPVWGTERTDEFGELSRAVDGFRRQAAEIPDISLVGEEGRLRFKFEGGSADLFTALTKRLREAGEVLTLRGAEVGKVVAEVRSDLTEAVTEVKELCTEVAASSAEGNAKLARSSDMLAHAAAQVEAFDARGPGGGLDRLIGSLKSNADELADLLTGASREITVTLRAVAGTEGQMREATTSARDATKELTEAMAVTQERLFTAVKLLKASGDKLSTAVDDTGERLTRAADSVDAGERALMAALGQATSTLDEVTSTAAERLADAAAHMSRSADLLESQAAGVGGQLYGVMDELREASGLLRQTTETQSDRLEPLAGQMERLESNLSGIVTEVGLRAGEIGHTLDAFQTLAEDLRVELDRLRVEPDARAATEEMFTRMADTLHLLSNQVEVVEDSAKRLAQSLAGGVDDATSRLRDAAAELQSEGRALAADAATATAALTRTAARQDQILETMAEHASLASDLKDGLAEAGSLSDALGAATEAVQALASSADRTGSDELAEMAGLLRDLRARVDGLDLLAGNLAAAAETVRTLMDASDRERSTGTEEQKAMAALAADLRERLSGVERLGAELGEATRTVRGMAGDRDEQTRRALAGLTQALDSRMTGIDSLSGQLTQAIDTLRYAAERNNSNGAASAAASRELGQKLAQVAEQLRATATGLVGS